LVVRALRRKQLSLPKSTSYALDIVSYPHSRLIPNKHAFAAANSIEPLLLGASAAPIPLLNDEDAEEGEAPFTLVFDRDEKSGG